MYEPFFELSCRPFAAAPAPNLFLDVEPMQTALDQLSICVHNGQGIGIVTAHAGLGKTLLCQLLVRNLAREFACVLLSNANFSTTRSLLQAILYELGHPYCQMSEQELRLELTTAVKELPPEKQAVVIVVDEAHVLSERMLEELRMITNLVGEGESLVRLILCGDWELEETLTKASLSALNQRVACHLSLRPLNRAESCDYIAHRLNAAGRDVEEIFTEEAVQLICHASDGVPRCLNQLCDHSLLLAYVSEERPVTEETVREALDDLKQLPLKWNDPLPMEVAEHEPLWEAETEDEAASIDDVEETLAIDDSASWETEIAADDEQLAAFEVGEDGVEEHLPSMAAVEVGGDECETTEDAVEETTPEVSVDSFEDTEVAPTEVIEIGADETACDNSSLLEVETREETFPSTEQLAIPQESAPISDAETIEQPSTETEMNNNAPAETIQITETQRQEMLADGFIEEPVIDNYARLDAGLPPLDPVPETMSVDFVVEETVPSDVQIEETVQQEDEADELLELELPVIEEPIVQEEQPLPPIDNVEPATPADDLSDLNVGSTETVMSPGVDIPPHFEIAGEIEPSSLDFESWQIGSTAFTDDSGQFAPDQLIDRMLEVLHDVDEAALEAGEELNQITAADASGLSSAEIAPETEKELASEDAEEVTDVDDESCWNSSMIVSCDPESKLLWESMQLAEGQSPEEQLGEDVLNLCIETHYKVLQQRDAGTTPIEHLPSIDTDDCSLSTDTGSSPCEYDVVQPDEWNSDADEDGKPSSRFDTPEDAQTRRERARRIVSSGGGPHREYSRLFSELRRRHD